MTGFYNVTVCKSRKSLENVKKIATVLQNFTKDGCVWKTYKESVSEKCPHFFFSCFGSVTGILINY